MYLLVIKPRAAAMMQEAYWWYEEQKEGPGEDFLTKLDSYFLKIKTLYETGPISNPEYLFWRI